MSLADPSHERPSNACIGSTHIVGYLRFSARNQASSSSLRIRYSAEGIVEGVR